MNTKILTFIQRKPVEYPYLSTNFNIPLPVTTICAYIRHSLYPLSVADLYYCIRESGWAFRIIRRNNC